MLRKITVIFLAMSLSLALCACGSDISTSSTETTTSADTTSDASTQNEAAEQEQSAADTSVQEDDPDAEFVFDDISWSEYLELTETTVLKSAESPTGYYVTFRYQNSDTDRMRISGYFDFTNPIDNGLGWPTKSYSAEEWQDGFIPKMTTREMEKIDGTDIWVCTIPLPAGTYPYMFLVGGAADTATADTTGAEYAADPANTMYADDGPEILYELFADNPNKLDSCLQARCETSIYVPYDSSKYNKSPAYELEAPRDGENGTICYEHVTDGNGVESTYGIYLPYGFDKDRAEKYPVLVMQSAGNSYYGSWFNTCGLQNILDNAIAEGKIEPLIVVTPDPTPYDMPETDYKFDREALMDLTLNYILPNLVENYNATEDPEYRGLGGFSMAAASTAYALFHNTDEFGTYLILSGPVTYDIGIDTTIDSLKDKNILIGWGSYDETVNRCLYSAFDKDENGNSLSLNTNSEGSVYEYYLRLTSAGINVHTMVWPMGHTMNLARCLMEYAIDYGFLWNE